MHTRPSFPKILTQTWDKSDFKKTYTKTANQYLAPPLFIIHVYLSLYTEFAAVGHSTFAECTILWTGVDRGYYDSKIVEHCGNLMDKLGH